MVGTHVPRYGFQFNATKDAYEVNEAEMEVVRRIFYMVGTEGQSLRAVAKTFEREGLPTPKRAKHWNRSFLRACIRDDVYRPHTFEEVQAVVAPEVAARLDPDRLYGLWWFNRLGHKVRQISEPSGDGRRYRKTHDWFQKPKEEWIAVPVPASAIPRGEIEAARAAIEGNRVPARAGRRFWELTGGIARCEHLKDRAFFVGDHYSIADIALYAYTHVADEGGFDLGRFAAVRAWLERVRAQSDHIPITQA